MDSARQNQRDSPLLRLPAELRNQIFQYALGCKTWTFLVRESHQQTVYVPSRLEHALALLAVCRQIYAETALLPFSLDTFSFDHYTDLQWWLKAQRPAQSDVVSTISIHHRLYLYGILAELYDWRLGKWESSRLPALRVVHVKLSGNRITAESGPVSYSTAFNAKVCKITDRLESTNPGIRFVIEKAWSSA